MIDRQELSIRIRADLWAWFKGDPRARIERDTAVKILDAWLWFGELRPFVDQKLRAIEDSLTAEEVALEAMWFFVHGLSQSIAAEIVARSRPPERPVQLPQNKRRLRAGEKTLKYMRAQLAKLRHCAATL